MIFRKGFLFLLLALLGLLVIILVFAGDPIFSSALRKYGPKATGQRVDFETASLSILSGKAQVGGLQLGRPRKPLIKTESILFDAAASDLLAGRLFIENAEMLDVHLRLVIDKNGRFEFDPGPPPDGTQPDADAPSDKEELPPTEERDVVQIVSELWERYQTYKGYYDEYGGIFGGGASEEEAEEEAQRLHLAGRPAYLDQALMAEPDGGEPKFFQMKKAEIRNLSWESIDKRTGMPFLPELRQGTLTMLEIGTPDGKSTVHANAEVADGGTMAFSMEVPKNETDLTEVSAEIRSLPVDSFRASINRSLPYKLKGGTVDLVAKGLQFNDNNLSGRVRVELFGATFKESKRSKPVLGVKPAEFVKVVNRALKDNAIAFDFVLGGTPTRPTFRIENATDLDDLIIETLKEEAKERLKEEVDEAKEKLEDKVQDKAADLLGEKSPELGNLFGGKDKKKKDG